MKSVTLILILIQKELRTFSNPLVFFTAFRPWCASQCGWSNSLFNVACFENSLE